MMSRVLIAEDNPDMARMCRIALEHRGHSVVVTSDGAECIRAYRDAATRLGKEQSRHEPFDIVILDSRMPRVDGAEAAREILSINKRQRLAFAAAYIGASNEAIRRSHQVEILNKPFEVKELIELVENDLPFA